MANKLGSLNMPTGINNEEEEFIPDVEESEEDKRKRLAAERAARIQSYIPQATDKSLPTSQQYVEQMGKLASDPTYMPQDATPEERKSLQNILDAAQSQFEDAQTRAEWQDVAQTLGKALVQYGAARTGGGDRDLSNIAQPTVDYGARINAAQQALAGRQKTALSKFELDKQAKSEEAKQREDEYKNIVDALEAGRRTAADREREQSSLDRALKQEAARARSEAANRKPERPDYTPIKLQLDDLSTQEKELSKEIKSAQQLFNDQTTVEDLSKKPAADLKKNYGKLAAEAGIDINELSAKLEATDKPGRFFGTNPDPEARKNILKEELAPKLNMLREIRAQKQSILNSIAGGSETPQASPAVVPQQQSSTGAVRIQAPDGTIAEVAADKAQKYLSRPGYKQVK